jgi:hypothetical protein
LYQLHYQVENDTAAYFAAAKRFAPNSKAAKQVPPAMQPQRWNTVGVCARWALAFAEELGDKFEDLLRYMAFTTSGVSKAG